MPEPAPESVQLARAILSEDGNVLINFLAATIGQVMRLNYDGLTDIFNSRRGEFEGRGADDLLQQLQSDVDNLFSGFVNIEE